MHAHDLCGQPFVLGLSPTCDESFPSQGKVFRDDLKPHNFYSTFPFYGPRLRLPPDKLVSFSRYFHDTCPWMRREIQHNGICDLRHQAALSFNRRQIRLLLG